MTTVTFNQDLANKIVDTIIDNGRLSEDATEAELVAEIQFECLERGIPKSDIADYIEWAIAHVEL